MHELSIKIRDIRESEGDDLEVGLSRALLTDALQGMDADLTHSHVTAHLNLSRAGDNVFVRGRLSGEMELVCARCLGPAHLAIEVPFRLTATPDDMVDEEPEGDAGEDVDYFTHDGNMLELAAVIREALILAAPMTTTCRPDCQGLCPACGADRNQRECGCVAVPPDPRFSALKGLKV